MSQTHVYGEEGYCNACRQRGPAQIERAHIGPGEPTPVGLFRVGVRGRFGINFHGFSFRQRRHRLCSRKRQNHDVAAVGTKRQMPKDTFALGLGKRLLGKGGEQIRIRVRWVC